MRTLSLVALLMLCQVLSGQIDLEAGLVAYYPFSGNANDESDYQNNASTIQADLVEGVNGEPNEAFSFDGINDHIIVPHANQINFNNQQPFTISVWVKVPEEQIDGEGGDFISKWTNSGTQPYPFVLRVYNQNSAFSGQVRAVTYVGDLFGCASPTAIALNSTTAINDNKWHHIVFSRNDQGFLQLYIDCQLEAEAEDTSNCTTQNNADLYIGLRVPQPPFRVFTGAIDEIRIYNRKLNDDEINSICLMVSSENLESQNKVALFPNPIKSGAVLYSTDNQGLSIDLFTIYNASGQNLGDFRAGEKLILPPGFYTVQYRLNNGEQTYADRLIVID